MAAFLTCRICSAAEHSYWLQMKIISVWRIWHLHVSISGAVDLRYVRHGYFRGLFGPSRLSKQNWHVIYLFTSGYFSVWPFLGSEYYHKLGLLPKCDSSTTSATAGTSQHGWIWTNKHGCWGKRWQASSCLTFCFLESLKVSNFHLHVLILPLTKCFVLVQIFQ